MTAPRWIGLGFFVGVVLALGSRAAPTFFDAYLEASKTRFDIMTAEPEGETSYLINVDDFAVLEAIAAANPDIVALNAGNFTGFGRVTFSSAQSPAIDTLRHHPNTAFMLSATIPLICH